MSNEAPFAPKQASPKTAAIFAEIVGTSSEEVTSYILRNFLPPFPSDAVIHDNGCGIGAVTSTILSSSPPPPPTIKIHCTDANAYMIDSVLSSIKAKSWPNVTASVMRAQALTFPSSFFTHSFTTFVVAQLDDPAIAASHLHRTLQPGGSCIVTTWKSMPHDEVLKNAHKATRGERAQLALKWGGEWLLPSKLKDFMLSGGFEEGKVRMEECVVWLKVRDLKRWGTILWSFLGAREGTAWEREDEERWDEVVSMLARDMEASPDCEREEDGSFRLRFVANVAVATK